MQASDIQPRTVPGHRAIFMDGTTRGPRREGYPGGAGHRAGAEVVREIVSACESRGIRYLTLFAFSSENWGRPRTEVRALLTLLSLLVLLALHPLLVSKLVHHPRICTLQQCWCVL